MRRRHFPRLLRGIGPEVLAAASDNDPTNVGTAAAVGAQTGYQLSWVALLVAPLLAVVLAISAQVGMVAKDDLQSLTRKHYGQAAATLLLVSVVLVNLVTIAGQQHRPLIHSLRIGRKGRVSIGYAPLSDRDGRCEPITAVLIMPSRAAESLLRA